MADRWSIKMSLLLSGPEADVADVAGYNDDERPTPFVSPTPRISVSGSVGENEWN